MNVDIKKIENGYVVKIGQKETFCSEAMGICGLLAEWAQAEVDRLEKGQSSDSGQLGMVSAETQRQIMEYMSRPQVKVERAIKSLLSDWE